MSELLKKVEKLAGAYAKAQGAELSIKYEEETQKLDVEMSTPNHMASVFYGPEDWAAGATAEDVVAFLKKTWEDA
ncbi:MAG: hypothetical protein IKZ08_02975 [Bacteroidales bacterium]|nr:hypothetical protein [Bacteroidales bacterium]